MQIDLDLAAGMLGKPLTEDARGRVLAVVADPSQETWADAYSIVLAPHPGFGLTLWQAVLAVDPTFPQRGPLYGSDGTQLEGWERIPTTGLLEQAINYATR